MSASYLMVVNELPQNIYWILIGGVSLVFALALSLGVTTVVLRVRNDRKTKMWQQLEREWEPLALSYMTEESTAEDVWKHVKPEHEGPFLDYLIRFAIRFRGDEREAFVRLARSYLAALISRLQSQSVAEDRAQVIHTLGILGMPEHVETVVAALDDPSSLVAMTAARALAHREYASHAGEIAARLHRFQHWNPNYLATMLSSIGPEGAPALRSAYVDTAQPEPSRVAAAKALGSLNDFESGDAAAQTIQQIAGRDLTAESLRLLARVGNHDHTLAVKPLLGSSDDVIRAHAIGALGSLDPSGQVPTFEGALQDSSSWVRSHAARGLMASKQGREILETVAESDQGVAVLAQQMLAEEAA